MKVGLSLCLALAAILVTAPASAVEPFVLYDDFKTPLLDPDKWFGAEELNSILEVFRGTSSNRLVMENRAYGGDDTNVGRVRNTLSTRFRGGAAVTAIRATVRVDAFEVTACPTNPSGLIGSPKTMSPPRFTAVLRSKVGTTPPFFAFMERTHQIRPVFKFRPPIKRLPTESTSKVPHAGEFGMLIGFIQVAPPSVDRVNCLPP